MRKILALTLLVLGTVTSLYSQRTEMPDKSDYYSFGENFYAAVYSFPAVSPDSIVVTILYRVRYAGLNFVKNSVRPDRGKFIADLSTEAALKDSEGIIRRRLIGADTVYVNSFEETNSKSEYVVNFLTSTVPNDSFKVSITVYDKNTQKFQKVDFPASPVKPNFELGLSQPVFAADYGLAYAPFVLNHNLPFQLDFANIIIFAEGIDKDATYRYSIKSAENSTEAARGEFSAARGNEPKFALDSKGRLTMLIDENPKMTDRVTTLTSVLDYRKFKTGKYVLNVWKQGRADTVKTEFSVLWGGEPLSLKNVGFAIELMKPILTEEEYDKISDGNETEQRKHLYDYWKKRDPTPDTEYNEAMAEFYKRADYAHFNFQTLTERDGTKTDRGRVYIFYGPPDEITTGLSNGKTQETWLYRKLNKEFTFETVSIGVVKLSEIKQ